MAYQLEFDREALEDIERLRAFDRAAITDTIQRVLTVSPTQVGQSRIKRLRGTISPQYRLRVGNFRVFYDVDDEEVYVIRVLAKDQVDDYLKEQGHEG